MSAFHSSLLSTETTRFSTTNNTITIQVPGNGAVYSHGFEYLGNYESILCGTTSFLSRSSVHTEGLSVRTYNRAGPQIDQKASLPASAATVSIKSIGGDTLPVPNYLLGKSIYSTSGAKLSCRTLSIFLATGSLSRHGTSRSLGAKMKADYCTEDVNDVNPAMIYDHFANNRTPPNIDCTGGARLRGTCSPQFLLDWYAIIESRPDIAYLALKQS